MGKVPEHEQEVAGVRVGWSGSVDAGDFVTYCWRGEWVETSSTRLGPITERIIEATARKEADRIAKIERVDRIPPPSSRV